MPVLVVPGVCRFSLYGTISDRPWVNIVDMHINTSVVGSRDDAIQDQAEVLNQEWSEHWSAFLGAAWTHVGCRWVDLDSAGGSTGETSETSGAAVLPNTGDASGEIYAGNIAILVRKNAGAGRGTRPGRWYVPGSVEANVAGNNLHGGVTGPLATMLGTLLSSINQSGGVLTSGTYDSELVVVHAPALGPASFTNVTSLAADTRLATQRRRLRA